MDPTDIRMEYNAGPLEEAAMDADPTVQWQGWFDAAAAAEVHEPNAMVLATVDATGWPQARNVLLKGADEYGFTFFTNYESAKAAEIEANSRATLLFSWLPMHRQVRIVGMITRTSDEENDAYFESRPRGSQIGAWASPQSDLIADRSVLEQAVVDVEARFGDGPVDRPPQWGGYRVAPVLFEFWQGQPSRLHDRLRYVFRDSTWQLERLAP